MRYIHFIVNPISGKGNHVITAAFLREHFSRDKFKIEVDLTAHQKHAIELTKKAMAYSPDCIVACGGDGTINEVASQLVNTEIKLGIIPLGSGNGLASNLNIPRDIMKAIEVIKENILKPIDVGTINGHYFFSNTGTGIDALIIKQYENSGKRTLISYIKASLKASRTFQPKKATIILPTQKIEVIPFMLFISNSNEMGYNMSLTPNALLDDGLLDVVIILKISLLEKLLLGWYVLRNKTERFRKASRCQVKALTVEYPEKIFTDSQIDGEYCYLRTNKIDISVISKGIYVHVPNKA